MLRVKFARIEHHWSQDTLSEKTGIDRATISLIENGRLVPTADHVVKLSVALGVPPALLLLEMPVPVDPSDAREWLSTVEQ